jgi:hypothetical protein
MIRNLGLAATALILWAGASAAQPGSPSDPIPVHMKRGTYAVRLTGALRAGKDCCAYVFKAHAGQTLRWRFSGPAARMTITSPSGDTDGPGLPSDIPLQSDGAYVLTVHPNLMADGAYGRYTLTLSIPPLSHHR